ncbi:MULTISPECIES: hypothetical protein [Streptomyces]|uniref:hypothetical protein n=1 Tax=Streptomyces TaxID=1883 RepID=UPI00103E37C8|nr:MULTISPECIES: hypothetical protein [Streptomyces]MBT3073417.1 hypothetical protein [Streptomyces sp. COG21]MBT3083326.1 hypothetical protein [Streptomyces sp. COG20]MBT3088616.1 hypothetical protein [Streptomyces sp. CYG21]MBT3097707.1 hypothetical protein [Streptomyces sp. CBG30]MBT3102037.1 hypothetical protein [Streptomyces sp. COG19]
MLVRTTARDGIRRPSAARGLRATAVAMLAAAALASCTQGTPQDAAPAPASPSAAPVDNADSADQAEQAASEPTEEPALPAEPAPEAVRDAFATLQATLNDTCTPGAGDCAYFLGRVTQELTELDEAMRADPKGPGHFKQPLADMKTLFTKLGTDRSTPHLEKHFSAIVGTRDGINTWMKDHPDDYR